MVAYQHEKHKRMGRDLLDWQGAARHSLKTRSCACMVVQLKHRQFNTVSKLSSGNDPVACRRSTGVGGNSWEKTNSFVKVLSYSIRITRRGDTRTTKETGCKEDEALSTKFVSSAKWKFKQIHTELSVHNYPNPFPHFLRTRTRRQLN